MKNNSQRFNALPLSSFRNFLPAVVVLILFGTSKAQNCAFNEGINKGLYNAAQATVNDVSPVSADACPDQFFCVNTNANLAAVVASSGNSAWAPMDVPNAIIKKHRASTTSLVTCVIPSTYIFCRTANSIVCSPIGADETRVISGALPVRLLLFGAEKKDGNVLLVWKTANEQTFAGFVVERSTDSLSFRPLATILAKGAASNKYEFTDNIAGLSSKTVYYRLKMVDANASDNYSAVKNIRPDKTAGSVIDDSANN